MDRGVSVEGNILLEDEDDDSSVSSDGSAEEREEHSDIPEPTSLNPRFQDDEEEEIEVFHSGSTTKKAPEFFLPPSQTETKKISVENVVPPPAPVIDEFGVAYAKRNIPEWFDKSTVANINPVNTVIVSEESISNDVPAQETANTENTAEDDEFAVVDSHPIANDHPSSAENPSEALSKALQTMKEQSHNSEEENINFEKELAEYPQDRSAFEVSEKVLNNNKLYTNSFNIFTGNNVPLTQQNSSVDEPVVFLDENKRGTTAGSSAQNDSSTAKKNENNATTQSKSVLEDSKKALADFIEVYGQGMGDQEVLLLDLKDEEEQKQQGKVSLKKNSLKESEVRNTQKIDKTLNAIAEDEEEEEEDEDEDNEEGERKNHASKAEGKTSVAQPAPVRNELEEEWNSIVVDQQKAASSSPPLSTNVKSSQLEDGSGKNNSSHEKVTYDQLVDYFQSMDLSAHESSIVTSDQQSKDTQKLSIFKSFFSSSPSISPLSFPNADNLLKFPFLIAQVDYDPFNPRHINVLRTIYYSLMDASCSTHSLSPIDEKWENLGFQGKDPRTDLNRAIKMLSLVQMMGFLESNRSLAKYLFEISQSSQTLALQMNSKDSRGSRPKNEVDYSWPFMCVSIMLSRESLLCLRSGQLNDLCNKRKNIMNVLNLFHQACFAEFGK
jgi:hypothetical protein